MKSTDEEKSHELIELSAEERRNFIIGVSVAICFYLVPLVGFTTALVWFLG